jgi:hypothetical protein
MVYTNVAADLCDVRRKIQLKGRGGDIDVRKEATGCDVVDD